VPSSKVNEEDSKKVLVRLDKSIVLRAVHQSSPCPSTFPPPSLPEKKRDQGLEDSEVALISYA